MGLVVSLELPEKNLPAVYLRLASLPQNLSSVQMSDGEEDPRFPVTFEDLANKTNVPVNTLGGYFLHARAGSYGVNFFKDEAKLFIECASDKDAVTILRAVGDLPIIYSWACQFDERMHQNRITAKKKYGTEETWVGRDYHRYLPGIYWLNLIPKSLLDRHGIPENAVKAIATSFEEMGAENLLIQLYPSSSDWQKHAPKIDEWRRKTPGVFYKDEAEKALIRAGNFLEASDAMKVWQ